MRLNEQISKINEIIHGDEFDKSKLIKQLLDVSLVQPNSDLVCKVEVKHPKDREVLEGQEKYISYSITVTVIGGYGTKYWPRTMAVNDIYDDILNQAWFLAYDFTNTASDVYLKIAKNCDE